MIRCKRCQLASCTCGEEDWEDYQTGGEAKVENESLRQQLAECKATNGMLREALNHSFIKWVRDQYDLTYKVGCDGAVPQHEAGVFLDTVEDALALPNDATALNELIDAKVAERTAEVEKQLDSMRKAWNVDELIAERTASLTAEVERQREQLFHIVKECDASATQLTRILRIKARADSTLSGDAPDFSSVKDRREDKIRHIGQLNYLNDKLRQQNAELTAEVERLRLFDNLAKEYGLSVFADIAELTAQRDEAIKQLAWNRKIRDSVDDLLNQGGDHKESGARHQLSLMNFDTAIANCKE